MQSVIHAALSSSGIPHSLRIAVLLLGLSGASWSQPDSAKADPVNRAPATKPPPDDPQQRRTAVRAALEAQREQKLDNVDPISRGRRQLSPEERQELRQQLRQQRN